MNNIRTNLVRQGKSNPVIQKYTYNLTKLEKMSSELSEVIFGKIIKAGRIAAKLTQEELAKLAKISKGYVGTIENARPHTLTGALSRPERDVAIKIIGAINSRLDFEDQIDMAETLALIGHAAPKVEINATAKLPYGLDIMDFDGLDRDDIAEIKALINAKKARKERKNNKPDSNDIPF